MTLLKNGGTFVSTATQFSEFAAFVSRRGSTTASGKYSVFINGYVTCR